MKITKQDNTSECGICVINSFIKYYFNKDIKNELLNTANITHNGLSILEFEKICNQFNLIANSYEATIDELFTHKMDKYFCLLIDNKGCNHYVIGSIVSKNKIKIFDSINGEYTLDYEQLGKIFLNVIISVHKMKNKKINNLTKTYWFDQVSISYLLINVFSQLFIVSMNLLFGLFFNLIIDLCMNNQDIKILLLISFSFLSISIINNLSRYLLNLYVSKYLWDGYLQCKTMLFNNLFNKKANFFYKINPNYFYCLNSTIIDIVNFNIQTIPEVIASGFINLVCLVVIFSVNYNFGFIVAVIVLFEIIYAIINNLNQKKFIDVNINNSLQITKNINDYINNNFVSNNLVIDNLAKNFNFNYLKNIENIFIQSKYQYKISFTKSLFQDFIYILTIIIGTIIIWHNSNFNIGKMLFIINTLNIFYFQINNVCVFINKRTNYLKMRKIFLMFYEIDNISNNNELSINKIKSISINVKNKLFDITNGQIVNIPDFLKIILQMVNAYENKECEIKINGFLPSELNQKFLSNAVCYFSLMKVIDIADMEINKIMENEQLIKLIRKFDIPLVKVNFIDQSKIYFLNLIYLCLQKDKIIILDGLIKGLTNEMKQEVNKKIIPLISKNNFLIINEQ